MAPRWFLLLQIFLTAAETAKAAAVALPGCPDRCGNITVPFPFGIAPDCYRIGFGLKCDNSYSSPRLLMNAGKMVVPEIRDAELVVEAPIARDCYKPLNLGPDLQKSSIDVTGTPFNLSYRRNKFTALGCDSVGLNSQGSDSLGFYSGCMSFCTDASVITNGTCEGIGCCQISIPRGLQRFGTIVAALRNHTTTFNFSPCSFAFLIDQDSFNFKLTDLFDFARKTTVPVILDWAIGHRPCKVVMDSFDYACGINSYCVDATNGQGYNCRCNNGYQGNPYLSDGCQGNSISPRKRCFCVLKLFFRRHQRMRGSLHQSLLGYLRECPWRVCLLMSERQERRRKEVRNPLLRLQEAAANPDCSRLAV